jgi:hypothetical protein
LQFILCWHYYQRPKPWSSLVFFFFFARVPKTSYHGLQCWISLLHNSSYNITIKVRSFHSAHNTLFIFLTFTVDRLLKFLCFFQYGTQIVFFFFCDYMFFGSNSKTTKSNLLTKDKIKRQGTRVEKVSQRNNSFKMLTSILKLYNLHKFDPLICFQFDFGTNFHFCYF